MGGVGCLVGAGLFARQLPRLRQIIHPIYVSKGILPQVATGIRETITLLVPPAQRRPSGPSGVPEPLGSGKNNP